jgi:hypothetical protein
VPWEAATHVHVGACFQWQIDMLRVLLNGCSMLRTMVLLDTSPPGIRSPHWLEVMLLPTTTRMVTACRSPCMAQTLPPLPLLHLWRTASR